MKVRVLAVVALVALPVGACSSSSKSSSSSSSQEATATTLASSGTTVAGGGDKASFVAQANQACTVLAQLPAPPGNEISAVTTSDLPAWSSWLQNAGSLGARLMTALRALTPPAGDEATVTDFLTKQQVSLDDATAAQKAAAAGDLSGFQTNMNKANTDGDTASQAESAYGLTTCGNGGASPDASSTTTGQ